MKRSEYWLINGDDSDDGLYLDDGHSDLHAHDARNSGDLDTHDDHDVWGNDKASSPQPVVDDVWDNDDQNALKQRNPT